MNSLLKDIKQILVTMACEDKLPLDLNELDITVFKPAVKKYIKSLRDYEVVFSPDISIDDEDAYNVPMIPLKAIKS